jgi:hypothetical protein
MENQTLKLPCPLCENEHSYAIAITRSRIRYFMGEYGPWYDREFTRLFLCPSKGQKFEATFVLSEIREDKIEGIDVQPLGTSQ